MAEISQIILKSLAFILWNLCLHIRVLCFILVLNRSMGKQPKLLGASRQTTFLKARWSRLYLRIMSPWINVITVSHRILLIPIVSLLGVIKLQPEFLLLWKNRNWIQSMTMLGTCSIILSIGIIYELWDSWKIWLKLRRIQLWNWIQLCIKLYKKLKLNYQTSGILFKRLWSNSIHGLMPNKKILISKTLFIILILITQCPCIINQQAFQIL